MNDVTTATDYKSTVFLPRTDFPMRGDLPAREPAMLARWEAMGLWDKLRAAAAGKPSFILHDGPPYANGNLHIGHALNKIHKDVINRAQQMAGRDANYIPGWDCHGLPIEWKIEEQYRKAGKNKDDVPILEFRKECRDYAEHWLTVQSEEFQRLGVAGDWQHRYATMDFASEAAIAKEIGKFLLNGALYRGLRPVMWSPVEKTALAEAEVEYHDKKDTAIWVKFPVRSAVGMHNHITNHWSNGNVHGSSIVIWTTTPWTIPGNKALAFGPELKYAVIRVVEIEPSSLAKFSEKLIVSADLLEKFSKDVGITKFDILEIIPGQGSENSLKFMNMYCEHPLRYHPDSADYYDDYRRLLSAEFVTNDVGTGFVHIAPGHGEEDFALCRNNDISVPETVADDGTYYSSVPTFKGMHVYKVADAVCKALQACGNLLHRQEFTHSYPHSWRSKAPLIYRATAQWFIPMDQNYKILDGTVDFPSSGSTIREKALAAIDETKFVPEIGRNRIRSMVQSRPDWCISRQRAWGVPIAIFVDKTTHEPLRDEAVMARIVEIFQTEGADAWYARPAQDFLGDHYKAENYEQVMDIVDVWFESGSTHAFVLEARGLPTPADVYLEGSDQHRGWFQASLLESVGTRGRAPFKAVVTDGFVLDEQGRKMSKSLGNVTAPQEVNDKYGADILRLWVMNSDTSEDLRIGPEILKQQAELYRRLRNTLRWILGSLDGFTDAEKLPESEFPELEQLILHRLWELNAKIQQAVASHDWTGVYPAIHHFCSTDLSAFYFDIRKDSLYCDRPDATKRRACRSLLDILLNCLTTWLAPALPFTAEETWMSRYGDEASVHLALFPEVPDTWRNDGLQTKWKHVRSVRSEVTNSIEEMRRQKKIGASLQATAIIGNFSSTGLELSADDWAEICITSSANLDHTGDRANTAAIAPGTKCERCWRVLEEVGTNHTHPTLCLRCCDAVDHLTA
jgi:isoleucyl-tRNA synthetase